VDQQSAQSDNSVESAESTLDRVFDVDQAAFYLGVKPETVAYHVYVGKNLKPSRYIGRSPVFVKEDLDCFKAERRKPGRPKGNNLADGKQRRKAKAKEDQSGVVLWNKWMEVEHPSDYAELDMVGWRLLVKRIARDQTAEEIEYIAGQLMQYCALERRRRVALWDKWMKGEDPSEYSELDMVGWRLLVKRIAGDQTGEEIEHIAGQMMEHCTPVRE
jgi:hypothetical protein